MHGKSRYGNQNAYNALSVLLAALSLSMLLRSPYLFALLAPASAFLYYRMFRARRDTVNGDSELRLALGHIIHNYTAEKNLTKALLGFQSNYSTDFAKRIGSSLLAYRSGIDAKQAFACPYPDASEGMREFWTVIADGLKSGNDITIQLDAIKRHVGEDHAYALRGLGAVKNTMAISRLGGTLFFPMFSGMSIGIVNASSTIYSTGQAVTASLTILFVSYIALINYLGFGYERFASPQERFAKAAAFGTIGIGIFEASRLLSNLII